MLWMARCFCKSYFVQAHVGADLPAQRCSAMPSDAQSLLKEACRSVIRTIFYSISLLQKIILDY